jgi:hypothetical protein
LDTSKNARSLSFSVTYSVKRSSCSVISRPSKKGNCSSGMAHDSPG